MASYDVIDAQPNRKLPYLTFNLQQNSLPYEFKEHTITLKFVYQPGGQTIWAGFMGCADTIAGSKGGPSNSSIESCPHYTYVRKGHCYTLSVMNETFCSLPAWSWRYPAFEPWDLELLAFGPRDLLQEEGGRRSVCVVLSWPKLGSWRQVAVVVAEGH